MGKAFTEEEKEKIKIRIIEEGLQLFHENGNKALSIRELTDRVGISQGGFYSFFKSKDDLMVEIVKYRSGQKMKAVSDSFEKSMEDPVGYFVAVMYEYFIDIAHKIQQKRMYSDMLHLIVGKMDKDDEDDELFRQFLLKLKNFWEAGGKQVDMDFDGIKCLVSTVCVLVDRREIYTDNYMDEILWMVIDSGIRKYVLVR